MDDISQETLHDFCRACLKKLKRQQCNIQSLDLQIRQWLQDATLDNPSTTDAYPNYVCICCRNKLKDFLAFRQMCASSRRKVCEILENKSIIKEQTECLTKDETIKHENEADISDETQVKQHFLRIDMVDNQDANGCTIKVETDKDSLAIEEPMISTSKSTEIKIEPDIVDPFTYRNDDQEEIHKDCWDEELNRNEEENYSNSDSFAPKEDKDCSSSDDSSNDELIKKNKPTETIGATTGKRKKYSYTFRCDQCKHRCVSQQLLDIHSRKHLGLKPHQCPKCDHAFDKSSQMLEHLKKIHGEKKYNIVCEHEDCGKKFKSSRSYKEHYRKNHIEAHEKLSEKTDNPADKIPNKHVCEECGKVFATLQKLKVHKYTHGPKELYPFQCTQCDKAFITKFLFREHQNRHDGIKNYECSYCGLKKTTKKELKAHVNSHTREKKYPCPNCPMILYSCTTLRSHVEVVHQGIRRFVCRFCNKSFGKGDNLKNHELLHTGEKPHECKECGKRFVQKVSLRLHMKTHNK